MVMDATDAAAATDANGATATTPPRTAQQVAAHLAASRATSVLASEHARLAELTAARATVDAAVARRRVAMAAADARAFQLRHVNERRNNASYPQAAELALAQFEGERAPAYPVSVERQAHEEGPSVEEAMVLSALSEQVTRETAEEEEAEEAEEAVEAVEAVEERGHGMYMFRASNGVLWRRSPQRGWTAVRHSERERRAANLPTQSHRLRQRIQFAEERLASLSLAEQDRAMDRVMQGDVEPGTNRAALSDRSWAHTTHAAPEEREVFRALRDEVALETAEEEQEMTAREIGEVPSREHNLWVIMISLPGCSRATAEACLGRHDGDLRLAFHEVADMQRQRWEGIAHIMAQFPWLTEADAETWYEACDESPISAILTIRRHRRLAANPEYVQRVHERVTDVIAHGGYSDFEATEAEAELLGAHPNPRAAWPPSVYEALRRDQEIVEQNVADNHARVNQLLARNAGASRRRDAADATRVTVVESADVLPNEGWPSEALEALRPIGWMERSRDVFRAHNKALLQTRLKMPGLESTKREPLVLSGCAVCMSEERPAKVAFGGCGHLCMCQDCALEVCVRHSGEDECVLGPCPICRQVSAPVLVCAS